MNYLIEFGHIMTNICKKKKISLGEISRECKLDRGMITSIKRGNRNSNFEKYLKIMNYLGIANFKTKKDFLRAINRNITEIELNKQTGIQRTTCNEYLNGSRGMTYKTACEIAEIANVKIINHKKINL